MMFPKAGKRRQCSVKTMVKTLDEWFSKYIRIRDADKTGMCRCVTCGTLVFWKRADCGHFISRSKKAVRYNPFNGHAQCTSCNVYQSGRQYEHGLEVDKRHGKGTAEMLLRLSQVAYCKMDRAWYIIKTDEFRTKTKALAREKGIEL